MCCLLVLNLVSSTLSFQVRSGQFHMKISQNGLLPVYPSRCSLLQVTNTDVGYPHYCRSCPCDRHDLYLPSIPDSLQTLGRCECSAACALAPLCLRIISPLTFYLSLLGAIWTLDKKLAPIFPSHLSTVAPQIFPDPRPPSHRKYM